MWHCCVDPRFDDHSIPLIFPWQLDWNNDQWIVILSLSAHETFLAITNVVVRWKGFKSLVLEHDGKKYDLEKKLGWKILIILYWKKIRTKKLKAYFFQQISFTFLYQSWKKYTRYQKVLMKLIWVVEAITYHPHERYVFKGLCLSMNDTSMNEFRTNMMEDSTLIQPWRSSII